MDLVARMHGSTFKAIMCRTRVFKHARARQAALCAVREAFPDISVARLGQVFGLDYSTIYNSFRKRGYQEKAQSNG
jgi:chromosomal replication initiation ATPase DnaA